VLLATAALTFAATAGPSLRGDSPVLRRYLLVPAAIAAVFFAVACLGWIAERTTTARRVWAAAGLALLLLALIVAIPADRQNWTGDRRAQAGRVLLLRDLHAWATAPATARWLRNPPCWPIRTPGYAYRPYLRYWLDVPAKAVAFSFQRVDPLRGLVLLPTARDGYQRIMLGTTGEHTRADVLADPAFRSNFNRVGGNSRWDLYAPSSCSRLD
jgi:hypothetical protein